MLAIDGPSAGRFESVEILKRLASASRELAEFKGVASTIPNQAVLVNTLGVQEARESSAIENLVTTNDELFRDSLFLENCGNPAAKEVLRYAQALRIGFDAVRERGLLTNAHILEIQRELERNSAGFRRLPGTALRDQDGRIVYTPPAPEVVGPMMGELETFINTDSFEADPLIRMALIHHQFETVHPFYDGNGRTGRIINVLYLVKEGLLDAPVLYMSRYIVRTKSDYYRLLQDVRERDAWDEWVLYMLAAVESTAREGIETVIAIRGAMLDMKRRIRENHRKIYSQELLNNLFSHPYTKIGFVERDLGVTRLTAAKYLDALAEGGLLEQRRMGRSKYYINTVLYTILTGERPSP